MHGAFVITRCDLFGQNPHHIINVISTRRMFNHIMYHDDCFHSTLKGNSSRYFLLRLIWTELSPRYYLGVIPYTYICHDQSRYV